MSDIPTDMLQDRRITVTQEEIQKNTQSQEEFSKHRQKYQQKQALYQRVIDLQKQLR
jgi:hypothetical protein